MTERSGWAALKPSNTGFIVASPSQDRKLIGPEPELPPLLDVSLPQPARAALPPIASAAAEARKVRRFTVTPL